MDHDQIETGRDEKLKDARALLHQEISNAVAAGLVDVTNASKAVDERMSALESRLDSQEKEGRKHDLPGSETESFDGESYNFGRVFQGLTASHTEGIAAFEKYCPMEYAMSRELYDMGTVPDTAGGFLVPTQVYEEQIIPLLRPQVIALDLGITQLPVTGAGVVEIPRETTGPTVDFVAENNANTAADLAFGNHRMEPHTAQSYVKASRRFLQLGVGADQFIRRRMAEELALTWNQWILKGTGASGQPIGIYNTTGVNTVSFTNAINTSPTPDAVKPEFYLALLEMEDALADANALSGASSLGWAVANKFVRAARQIQSTDLGGGAAGTALEMGRKVFSAGMETNILGYPFRRTTQLAGGSNTEAIFGDFSKAVLATWNNLSIEASNVADDALQKRQTHIVAYIDVDVAVTQPTAFAVSSNLDLSGI